MKELIQAIEAEATFTNDPERNFIYVDDVVELIETMLAGKVIVPVEPTDEMLAEIWIDTEFSHKAMTVRYKSMLEAANEN